MKFSYMNHGFYARGRYWIFYANPNLTCEGQASCLLYTSSSDGQAWVTSTNIGVHTPSKDYSVFTNGTYVAYVRYNETSHFTDCNRNLMFRLGKLSSTSSITFNSEIVA